MGCGGPHGTSPSHRSTLHANLIQYLVGLSVASVPSLNRYQNLEEEKIKIMKSLEIVSNKVHLNCVTILSSADYTRKQITLIVHYLLHYSSGSFLFLI